MYDTWKTLILLVGLLPVALLGHQPSHLQNNYFFPNCTIYYFTLPSTLVTIQTSVKKVHIFRICKKIAKKPVFNCFLQNILTLSLRRASPRSPSCGTAHSETKRIFFVQNSLQPSILPPFAIYLFVWFFKEHFGHRYLNFHLFIYYLFPQSMRKSIFFT